MLRIRHERYQRTVAGILYPVVALLQRCQIALQAGRESRLRRILFRGGALGESNEIGKEEAGDDRADRRARAGIDRLTHECERRDGSSACCRTWESSGKGTPLGGGSPPHVHADAERFLDLRGSRPRVIGAGYCIMSGWWFISSTEPTSCSGTSAGSVASTKVATAPSARSSACCKPCWR